MSERVTMCMNCRRQFTDAEIASATECPVAWRTFDGEGNYDYRDYENNEHYRDWYVSRNGAKYANWVEPLYRHPAPSDAEKRETVTTRELAKRIERGEKWKLADESAPCQSRDAKRLAEALRNLVSEWVAIADDGDATLEDSTIGYRACANRLSAMLAAYHAQAQPPAASVTDAMVERGLKACIQDSDVRLPRYKVVRSIIEAALAAQENPNG